MKRHKGRNRAGKARVQTGRNIDTLEISQQVHRLRWWCFRNKFRIALSLLSSSFQPPPPHSHSEHLSQQDLFSQAFSDSPPPTTICTPVSFVNTSITVPMILTWSYSCIPLLGSKFGEQGLCHLYFPDVGTEYCDGARQEPYKCVVD